ncbi:hypothetical protein BJY04DRAFT_69896 [Aspergillus karnatakaensis]|uniref:putative eukaryotic translation initiation factor subunit eIF-4F n=1 Tax=Aspergillus karnatakaensis TaxID=1810916 RepID=UPI003CCE3E16
MSSIPQQPGLQPQGQSTSTQAASHSTTPSLSGKASPQAPTPTSTSTAVPRSYANATKKSATDSTAATPVTVGGPSQHGKSNSTSVSGKPMQQSPNPTIVNGAPASGPPQQGDHAKKPSVTITADYNPSRAQAGGRPNSLQFGFQSSSPNMGNPAVLANQPQSGLGVTPPINPRATSPQTSPSPIPQPASSGGRPPPSSYQGQMNFGSFGNAGDNAQAPLGPGPQSTHLRRESSQSTHSDMSNHLGGGPGRGGYPYQGGRGRGHSQSGHPNQMYSPTPNYRTPAQGRGGHNMGPQYHGPNQGRPMPGFPSPTPGRSPALANAHPVTPQMSQVPMAHAQMPPQPYGAYPQHMGPQAVRSPPFLPHHKPPSRRGFYNKRKQGAPRVPGSRIASFSHPQSQSQSQSHFSFPPPNLAPESGHFEQYLTVVKHNQTYPYGDPNYAYYQGYQYMAPPSPQPGPRPMPYQQSPYMQNQFPVPQGPPQATSLSRTPSQVSDRPGSSLGQNQPAAVPSTPGHTHTPSRSSTTSGAAKPAFVIPQQTRKAITIRDPDSGNVKTFEKAPASPARASPSPVKIATPTPTPPPRTGSSTDHTRSQSLSAKTAAEKKQELKDAVLQKVQQEQAEARRKAEEEEATKVKKQEEEEAAQKKKEEDEARQKKEQEEEAAKKQAAEEEAARKAMEELSLKEKEKEQEKEKEIAAAEAKPAEPAPADEEEEIDFDAIEKEMAELEAKEAAAEAAYYAKKQAEKEERERKEKEELEAYEANMKQAEREAEALEEAKEKKRAAGEEAVNKDKDLFASLKKGGFSATETSTPADSGTVTPVSDVSMPPPAKPASAAGKQKPAALKLETTKAVEPPQPTPGMKSLHSARFVDDLSKIDYPAAIASPNPALNTSAPSDRKFHYNKEFLLQFQAVFKEKPSIDWDSRVRETVGDTDSSRPQSARTPMARNPSRGGAPGFQMGAFTQSASLPPGTTSAERFAMSNRTPSGMGANPFGTIGRFPMGGNAPVMSRANSSHNMSPRVASSNRSGTRTGSKREKNQAKKEEEMAKSMPLTAGKEVQGLQVSTSGWKPRSIGQAPAAGGPTPGGHMPPDVVQRKVKAALNKMTPENFERISGQILEIVSQSKDESDGRTLRQVIQLTFEKATDEAHWASIYAKFCKRMLESMSGEIKDENIRDRNGNVVAGGSLFRKYLLNRCQEEFERGWKVNLPPRPEGVTEEAAMMSDEYYIAAAAKRRGLGLVKFIGELYKLGMLTERIMHECVKKLVDYEGIPDEAEVESLTSLLRTIGASLDASEKGPAMMDAYFARINLMVQTPNLPSRLRFMLLDIIDLRSAHWKSKDSDKGPKTIQQIREEAARAQQEAEMERARQQANRGGGGRPAMGRGDSRNFSGGYGQAPPPDYASSKVGSDDLRRLRTTRTNQPMSFGPSSMLGSRSNSGRKNLGPGGNLVRGSDDSAASSRTGTPPAGKKEDKEAASSMNAFSALAQLQDQDNMATSPPSNPTSPLLTKSQPAVERRPSATPSTKDGEEAS